MLTRIPYGAWLAGLGALLLIFGISWKQAYPFSISWTPLVVPGLLSLAVGAAQLLYAFRHPK